MTHDRPLVSWLLCSHTANDTTRRAVASCLDQSFTDFELLFVSNGIHYKSVTNTVLAWFGHDPRLRVFSTEGRHLTFSLNLGLHHARAELVARMDADDVAYHDRLVRQWDFMKAHPHVTVVGSSYDFIDAPG